LGLGFGAVTFLPVTQFLIDGMGWRGAWQVLAVVSMVLIIPACLTFLRRQPEDMGLAPDGDPVPTLEDRPGLAKQEAMWTVAQAMRTKAFWLLASAMVLYSFTTGGTSVHRIPYWVGLGFAPQLVSFSFAADAAGAAFMALAAGFLLDRFPARFVAAASFLGFAGAVGLMLVAANAVYMFASTVLFGLCVGINMVAQTYLWADYYGRVNLGTLRGVIMPAQLLASAIGAPTVGYIYDALGSYGPAWWLLICTYGVAFLLMMSALPPEHHLTHRGAAFSPP
jgi:MFS family permease